MWMWSRGEQLTPCRTALQTTCAFALSVMMVFSAPPNATAQSDTGHITGRVVSGEGAQPILGARVHVLGSGIGTLTDADGRYLLGGVPAGTISVAVEMLGFASKTVTGIAVTVGEVVRLDVALERQAVVLQGITVSAEADRGSAAALLGRRKRAAGIVNAIGAEDISRSPDGSAATALKQIGRAHV